MKSLLLIAAVLLTGALAKTDDQECEPGSIFKKECNTCRCAEDGKHYACTRRFCYPEEQSDDPKGLQAPEITEPHAIAGGDKDEEQVQTNGQVCTPNEVKMEDCNRCKCANNGIGWFCTRKACPPREKREAVNDEKQCVPGSRFKSADGCNNCFCTEKGYAACTQKLCLAKTKRQVSAKKGCVVGTTFKSDDGCNDCTCTSTGEAACTLRFCMSEPIDLARPARSANEEPLSRSKIAPGAEGFACTPGKSFLYQCNTCFCDNTGKQAGCTFKSCPPGEY